MSRHNQNETRSASQFFRDIEIEFLIHELKDPISIIESGTRAMLEKPQKYGELTVRQEKTLRRSLRNVRKVREMLNGLLEIGRSEAGQFACRSFRLLDSIYAVLYEVLDSTSPQTSEIDVVHGEDSEALRQQFFRQQGISFDIEDQVEDIEIVQDEIKFRQIFGNLLKNAIHHRKKHVYVRLAREGDYLQLDVADDGPGVKAEHHEAIFQRYTRLTSQPDLPRQGHGLGLAGALILARCLGGDIELHSTRGQGATFRLILPITFDREDFFMTDATYLKGARILAVDDEQDILESIEDILDDAELDTARDYETASQKVRDNAYDLAILDIMGVNGLQLLEETVAHNIPTVMLTAHAMNPETLMDSIRKGAISYLPKETLADLDELLEELLGAYKRGEAPWKLLFDKLGDYFDERFGQGWKEKDQEFWSSFSRNSLVGKGIQERLKHDPRLLGKGI